MKKETNKIVLIIIFSVVFFIAGGVGGYFFGINHHSTTLNRNNFTQIDDATKAQVTSVFNNATSIDDINNYCNTNRFACMYYCRTINPQNQFCSQLTYPTRGAPSQ